MIHVLTHKDYDKGESAGRILPRLDRSVPYDMKSKNGKKTKKVIIDVKEEDYLRSKAKGIGEDALLKPGRHQLARGANPLVRPSSLPATPPKKTRILILLEENIIEHFKKRAATPNTLPYQTQINNTLRAAVMTDRGVSFEVADKSVALHKNLTFIKAVAKIIKEQLAQE